MQTSHSQGPLSEPDLAPVCVIDNFIRKTIATDERMQLIQTQKHNTQKLKQDTYTKVEDNNFE